jgi:uncharacterized protein YjbI with pentapeptide repeats
VRRCRFAAIVLRDFPSAGAHGVTDTERRQIARINELSNVARTSWFGMLAFLGFVGVTLLGVQDADFFVPSRETVLPIVGVRIPTASFFWFAPALAAALYIHLHVHLQKLWDAIADAPSRVDGLALGDHLTSWLGNDLALAYKGGGALQPRPMARLVHVVSQILVWIAGPLVLAGFWGRSLPAHHTLLSLTIAVSLLVTLCSGVASWRHCVSRLRWPWSDPHEGRWIALTAAVGAAVLGAVTWITTERGLALDRTTPLVGRLLGERSLNTLVRADFTDVALVPLPPAWAQPETARLAFRRAWCSQELVPAEVCDRLPVADRPTPPRVLERRAEWCAENIPEVDCAAYFAALDHRFRLAWAEERAHARANLGRLDLAGRDLRGVTGGHSSLVGATLAGARLDGADLRGARLEGADLTQVQGEGIVLRAAQLQDAVLTEARLSGADLREARLEGALLAGTRLEGADLGEARLEGAYLLAARLAGADLATARLESTNLTVSELQGTDLRTARFDNADLRGARLDGADLRWAGFRGARWSGADLAAAPAHYADFRGARELSQAQLDGLVGNAGTLLPDRPAPDTREPFHVWSCWPEPPEGFDELVARLSANNPQSAPQLRASLLCPDGEAPRRTGTPCPLDRSREACLAPWR